MDVKSAPSSLDIAASRTGEKIYLHVANLEYKRAVEATFAMAGMSIAGGRVHEIAPEDLRQYVNQDQPDVFKPREAALPSGPDPDVALSGRFGIGGRIGREAGMRSSMS